MSAWGYFKEVKQLLLIKLVFATFEGFVPYFSSIMIISIVNKASNGHGGHEWMIPTLLFVFIMFLERMQTNIKMPVDSLLNARSKEYVQRICSRSVRQTNYETIESARYQEELSHAERYINKVSGIWDKILIALASITQLVTLTVLILQVNMYLIPILLIGVIPIWRSFTRQYKENHQLDKQIQILRNSSSYFYSMITNGGFIKEERIFKYKNEIKEKWGKLEQEMIDLRWQHDKKVFFRDSAYRFLFFITYFIAVSLLILDVFREKTGLGQMIAMLTVMRTYQNGLSELFFVLTDLRDVKQNYDEINNLHKLTFNLPENPGENIVIQRNIALRNVSFRYPNKETDALCNINLNISLGETIFIVGSNGSGKSTLIKLLTGLYRPTEGEIRYDDVLPKGHVYDNFTVLFQDYSKFPFSIRDNVLLFHEDKEEKLQDASVKAGLKKMIQNAHYGWDTHLGSIYKDAVNLSEGQWQRLALARAFYKDSPIYIFDEPTSALDPLAEVKIYDLYEDSLKNKTKIIISHRLGYARKADRILVMDNGQIAEQGAFGELMEHDGLFRRMYIAQKGLYAELDDDTCGESSL